MENVFDRKSLSMTILMTPELSNFSGVAFVFVKIFGDKTRLESVDSPKFSQVRNCIPETQIEQTQS